MNFFLKIFYLYTVYFLKYLFYQTGDKFNLKTFWKFFYIIKINLYLIFHIDFIYGIVFYFKKNLDAQNVGHYMREVSQF